MVMPSLAHALVIPDSLDAVFTIPGPIWLQPEICIQLAAVTE
jgi:hypothetical protein